MKRELDCGICETPVVIRSRDRFLQMVKSRDRPLCGQCRRYAREGSSAAKNPVTSRNLEHYAETEVTAIALSSRRGKRGRRMRSLASRKLRRVSTSGCEPRDEND